MNLVLSIAAGGAIGAVARYLVLSRTGFIEHHLGLSFPLGTLLVNILGSFLLGVLIEVSALNWSPSPEVRAFLVVGILGSFTTFSTFSLDTVFLLQRDAYLPVALYVCASVIVSVLALFGGMILFRQILP
ncbi:MAG: fluoride efflux transporter CrcB [Rhodospirillales bacterium]|nr:fluoride efflux transporter CrcB [Rhodospirillales bacterium]